MSNARDTPEDQATYSYGELLGKTRWLHKDLSGVSDDNDEDYGFDHRTLSNPTPALFTQKNAKEIAEFQTLRRYCRFERFGALPLELQTLSIEWLDYADLKCFE